VFTRFFETKRADFDDQIKRIIDPVVTRRGQKIIHAKNWTLRAGFLIPEGFTLTENVEESGGYTLTISRRGSLYKLRFYTRVLPPWANNPKKDLEIYDQEVKTFLAEVPKIGMMGPGESARRPGEARIAPGAWPALYREKADGCLVTFRAYDETAKGLAHEYFLTFVAGPTALRQQAWSARPLRRRTRKRQRSGRSYSLSLTPHMTLSLALSARNVL
jgi:hypothetical protein